MPVIKRFIFSLFILLSTQTSAMTLYSWDIQEGQLMPSTFEFKGFGCTGDNLSPQLSWHGAPEGTKSFAITAYDPDAPTGSGWWHWQVINIPADTMQLSRGVSGKLTNATELTNDYGAKGFGGACPPQGDGMHRYEFTVWALPEAKLSIPENASAALVGYMLNAKALDKAKLTATFVRQ